MKLLAILFSFNGRMDRGRFWAVQLGLLLLSGVFTLWDVLHDVNSVMAVLNIGGQGAGNAGQGTVSGLLAAGLLGMSPVEWIVTLVLGWIYLATQAKRFHDVGRSGWWTLLNLIPLVGPVWASIVTGFYHGTTGSNRYGPDPGASRRA